MGQVGCRWCGQSKVGVVICLAMLEKLLVIVCLVPQAWRSHTPSCFACLQLVKLAAPLYYGAHYQASKAAEHACRCAVYSLAVQGWADPVYLQLLTASGDASSSMYNGDDVKETSQAKRSLPLPGAGLSTHSAKQANGPSRRKLADSAGTGAMVVQASAPAVVAGVGAAGLAPTARAVAGAGMAGGGDVAATAAVAPAAARTQFGARRASASPGQGGRVMPQQPVVVSAGEDACSAPARRDAQAAAAKVETLAFAGQAGRQQTQTQAADRTSSKGARADKAGAGSTGTSPAAAVAVSAAGATSALVQQQVRKPVEASQGSFGSVAGSDDVDADGWQVVRLPRGAQRRVQV